MSSRCKACEAILKPHDLRMEQDDGSLEDLCGLCRWYAFNDEILEVREYAHQHLTDYLISPELHNVDDNY